ncbi:hypothetical protein HZA87_04300 [Candidatus Uhrbacteria bacterium]|nr:hypothetical protein [Candidatus Uhrbacteria bacterium]
MVHTKQTKNRVRQLREKGESIPAIAKKMTLPKSTVSLWVRDVILPSKVMEMLRRKAMDGRSKGRMMRMERRKIEEKKRINHARVLVKELVPTFDVRMWQLISALLYWCEGGKTQLNTLRFTNSDPQLIKMFLRALRQGFILQEEKFRAIVHLHGYHNDLQQKESWSRTSGIPISQFSKSYRKPNTGKRKRANYQGCLSVRYNDAHLARMLDALYHAIGNSLS